MSRDSYLLGSVETIQGVSEAAFSIRNRIMLQPATTEYKLGAADAVKQIIDHLQGEADKMREEVAPQQLRLIK